MLLSRLIEDDYQMNPQQMERWSKVIGQQDPSPQQMVQPDPQRQQAMQVQQKQQQKQRRGKEYRMKYKDEEGGGEYKVKVRQTKDNEVKYNYGNFGMSNPPDLSGVDTQKLTPKGYKVYQQIYAQLNQQKQPEAANENPENEKQQEQTAAN